MEEGRPQRQREHDAKRFSELTEAERKKKYNISTMTDEQIEDLMNSVYDSDDGSDYTDDDDSVADPDYDYQTDVLTAEDEPVLNLDQTTSTPEMSTTNPDETFLIQAVNLSLNVTYNVSEESVEVIQNLSQTTSTPEMATTELSTNDPESAQQIASTSTQVTAKTITTFKPPKRPRSPLPIVEVTGPRIVPSAGGFTGTALGTIDNKSKEFTNIIWRNKPMQLHVNEVAFRGKTELPYTVKILKTPMEYFGYFFTNELVDLIVLESNRKARLENINTQFNLDSVQIRRYIGILLFMSIFRYPTIPSHWGPFAFRQIPDCMSLKKFERIKKYLCFSNAAERIKKGQPGYDPLFRIRKVVNILNERFDSIPKNARLCVDEQMCSTKMVHHLRQYMPKKPHKWGIKLFVLCDSNGYSYQFEIYNGAGDNIIIPGTPDLGATSNVVIRLSQSIPNFNNHIVYFDNFYTSLPLLVYLRARGIFSLGTIRANRIPNCKLPLDSDREIKKADRGHTVEYMGSAYGVDLTTVLWKDTKNVRLCSTYVGVKPFQKSNPDTQLVKAARYDKKKKEYIEVNCPQIIREYNSHMGGVDLMDSHMGRRGLRVKTMDAMTRLFYHLLDMVVTNAFVLYRRSTDEDAAKDGYEEQEDSPEKVMTLFQFRVKIAQGLCALVQKRPVGRPSNEVQLSTSSGMGRKAAHPTEDARYDGIDHVPNWIPGRKKSCKYCKKSETHTFCPKCQLHLCYSGVKNCWKDYHVRP